MMLFQNSDVADGHKGEVRNISLRLFGTKDMPPVMKSAKRHKRSYNYQLESIVKKKFVSGCEPF